MAGEFVASAYTRGLSDPYCTSCGGHGPQPRPGLQASAAAASGSHLAETGAVPPSRKNTSISSAQQAMLENSGWVQVCIVNGSDDKVWWKVACHPPTDSVGSLRQRLAKGAGTFVLHLYRDGVALDDKLSVLHAGIDEYAILSTGHGASLVYGRKGAAALNEAKAKGESVVSDRDAKPRWSHAQPRAKGGQFGEAPASRANHRHTTNDETSGNGDRDGGGGKDDERRGDSSSSRKNNSSRSADLRRADREKEQKDRRFRRQLERAQRARSGSRLLSSSSSSSLDDSSSSCSSTSRSSTRHHRRQRHGHHKSSDSPRSHAAAAAVPTMIMPVAVCRCYSDPLLYPVPLSEMIQAASTRFVPPGHRRSAAQKKQQHQHQRLSGGIASSSSRPGTARSHTTAMGHVRADGMYEPHGERDRLSGIESRRKEVRKTVSSVPSGRKDEVQGKKIVSVSEVLNRAMPTTAKAPIEIGPQKEQTTGTERAAEIKRLQAHVKELAAEKAELEFQLKLTKTRAPPRFGLKTPAFPVDGHVPPSQMFLDEVESAKLPPVRPMLAPAQLCAHSAQQPRPGETDPHRGARYGGTATMPHYLIPGIPSGVYPYAAPYQWMSSMPPEAKAALESTITPTVAAPGLLKTYSALYPRGTFDHSSLVAHHGVTPL